MIADYLLKKIEPKFEIKELTILRYWKELVVDNDTVKDLEKKLTISQEKYQSI